MSAERCTTHHICDCLQAKMERLEENDRANAAYIAARVEQLVEAKAEIERLHRERLAIQADERALTCVYCGHVYPPDTPATNHQLLREHVATCPDHPAAQYRQEAERLQAEVKRLRAEVEELRAKLSDKQAGGPGDYDGYRTAYEALLAGRATTAEAEAAELRQALREIWEAGDLNDEQIEVYRRMIPFDGPEELPLYEES